MPKKTLTYVDSNVLIYAVNQKNLSLRLRALKVLGDKRRVFLASEFLRLETLPYAVAFGEAKEIAFLQTFFDRHVSEMKYGAEFVTAEKASKPFHQAYARCLWIAGV